LRGSGLDRIPWRPSLADDVIGALEDAAAPAADLPPGVTVRMSKGRLRAVLLCEGHLVATLGADDGGTSMELVAGVLLDRLFGLVVFGCHVEAPVEDALAAADIAGDGDLRERWESLTTEEQDEVRSQVEAVGRALAERWPPLPSNAFPRLQEPLRAALAGGRLVLSGRVDLALGRPTAVRVGTTLVDVKSGRRRHDDSLDADFYAVLETIRHRAPPFQSGNYYMRDGGLDLIAYDESRMEAATVRVAEGVRRMVRLASGGVPELTPNPLCPWCPAFGSCGPGRQSAVDQGFEPVGFDDDS